MPNNFDDGQRHRRIGAWLPWSVATALCRLELRTGSHWRVFLTVLLVSARYGGRDAHLGVEDLARMTGLATRTVKAALAALRARGLIERIGRTRRLSVPLLAGAQSTGVPVIDRPTRHHGRGSRRREPSRPEGEEREPDSEQSPFTGRQESVLAAVLAEASTLLGADAAALALPVEDAERLGLSPPVTYGMAYEQLRLRRAADPVRARAFVEAVLALHHDERVQGQDLA